MKQYSLLDSEDELSVLDGKWHNHAAFRPINGYCYQARFYLVGFFYNFSFVPFCSCGDRKMQLQY
ncbi:hypothetical protein BYT27DRAFT_6513510 [Phlegmacium glaucopus]|nr:hypothetical protein BYT27DRAFT_6513510 [Phlegmacium glaucopus]